MKVCNNCKTTVDDNALFCKSCGAKLDDLSNGAVNDSDYMNASNQDASSNNTDDNKNSFGASAYDNANGIYTKDASDHTQEFSVEDASENKLFAMLCYLGGIIGVIIAILVKKDSPYLDFHIRQSLKISVIEMLCVLPCVFLAWLVIPVFIVLIPICILVVIRIISFVRVAKGQSTEPEIIKNFDFLK